MKQAFVLGVITLLMANTLGADQPQAVSRVSPVVKAYQKASGAVVNISAEKLVRRRSGFFSQGSPFDDIFPDAFPRPLVRQKSIGSGVVIHPAGYVITNAHVVGRAESITIQFADKSNYPAKVVSSDPRHDLAILQVELPAGKNVAYLPLGRSDDLMVGETVIAIGNPLGFGQTLTTGVISATNRVLEFDRGIRYGGLIQTDAPINPGNSGGPLLNVLGQLIGINTAIRADAQNIGFAIAVNTLAEQLPDLLDYQRLNRVVLGAKVVQQHGPEEGQLHVAGVQPGTPAHGKLMKGDRVTALDGTQLKQIPDYLYRMMQAKAGQALRFTVFRNGQVMDVEVKLIAKAKPDGKVLADKLMGMTLRPVTPKLARRQRLVADWGLFVVGIDAEGPAAQLGIQLKDVLFQVDRFYVKDLDTLGMILEDVKPGQKIRIGVARGNARYWTIIRTRSSQDAKKGI